MKKKSLLIVLMALLVCAIIFCLSACGKNETEAPAPMEPAPVEPAPEPIPEPEAEPTPEPEPAPEPEPEPEPLSWEPGYARAGYAGALREVYNLGDTVTVIGEYDGYFVIELEDYNLLIESRYLRHVNEETFMEREGYSYGGTPVYETAYLDVIPDSDEDIIATLALNTYLTVIEGKENWLHITWDGGEGYVHAYNVSNSRIVYYGGGTGGSGPADGTDIDLGGLSFRAVDSVGGIMLLGNYHGPEYTEFEDCEGTILTNNCEAYMYLFDRDELVRVHAYDEETCTVVFGDDITATVPRWLIRMEEEPVYESWTGYAKSNAVLYSRYQMRDLYIRETLATNTELVVLDELKDFYVVEYEGEIRYVLIDSVSKDRIVYYGGGGGTGDTGGGDWTPPAM